MDAQNCTESAPKVIGRPFRPGDDARRNLGGRPKSKPVTEALIKELKRKPHNGKLTNLELGIKNLVGIFTRGRGAEAVAAYRAISAYIEGTPVQTLDIDLRGEAERIAMQYHLPIDKVVSLADELKRRRAG